MADRTSQPKNSAGAEPAADAAIGYYDLLRNTIDAVAQDPTMLRNMVYELARQNVGPARDQAGSASGGGPSTQGSALTIVDLAQMSELEKAIRRLEGEAGSAREGAPLGPSEAMDGEIMDSRSGALVPARGDRTHLTSVPPWLDPTIRISLDTSSFEAAQAAQAKANRFPPFLQLVAAAVLAVALYTGLTTWMQMALPMLTSRSGAPVDRQEAKPGGGDGVASSSAPPTGASAPAAPAQPTAPPQIAPGVPMPRAYGIYAVSDGKLFNLEQLPIKIPTQRVLVSAEIKEPSKTTVETTKPVFVVYRRDLAASAPSTVQVRVLARVGQEMKFVEGKPERRAVEASWRIRDKSYELPVSPVESNREMILIQPDESFALPPGRYALSLAGFGYDFTVAGAVTAPEQCLEQIEVVGGTMVAECPKEGAVAPAALRSPSSAAAPDAPRPPEPPKPLEADPFQADNPPIAPAVSPDQPVSRPPAAESPPSPPPRAAQRPPQRTAPRAQPSPEPTVPAPEPEPRPSMEQYVRPE